MNKNAIFSLFLLLVFSLGFRLLPFTKWKDLSLAQPTVWVRISDTSFQFSSTSLPSGDPLEGASVTPTSALRSVFNDFNQTTTWYVRLAAYPSDPANPPAPALGDSPFTLTAASTRTISINFGPASGTSEGTVKQRYENGQIVGCDITLDTKLQTEAALFIRDLGHEIGHCLGLDHPQDTTYALMSYYTDFSKSIRLQVDDKMGLTYIFPKDSSYNKETTTLGLSCNKQ
jgi:hypothetical protein